ncbi:MAG: DUF3052 domain-containing protein [SAR324 cluster bacterium]|nr:DUF3052 domain-containing protein [SAR324 cluster bacterium]
MAGYSGTPLAKKLGIEPGARVLLLGAPEQLQDWLAPLPDNVTLTRPGGKANNVIVFFTKEAAALRRRFPNLAKEIESAGGLWIAWPKKSSGDPTDLNDNVVREIGLAAGLVDNKVCAISEVWSGLRFVYRLTDRPPIRQGRG